MTTSVSVDFYPARISDTGLSALHDLVLSRVLRRAPAFGGWLDDVLSRERLRRLRLRREVFVEVDIPAMPIAEWTDSDIAGALQAATILSYVVRDPAAGKLVDRLVVVITAAACSRLRSSSRKENK